MHEDGEEELVSFLIAYCHYGDLVDFPVLTLCMVLFHTSCYIESYLQSH
jgi:hypothetical protein